MSDDTKAPITVLIPTRNEERNLADCLAAVEWADDIVVFDSHSEDATLDIALSLGARVVQREFDDFSTHKNWAIDNIDFRNEWILHVDADERVTPALAEEIRSLVSVDSSERSRGASAADSQARSCNGYFIARKNYFAGRWIRRGGWYPDWQLRLFRRGHARYEPRIVHEHFIVDGEVGYLKNALEHNDYKGIERWFDRHNHYSSLEAVEVVRMMNARASGSAGATGSRDAADSARLEASLGGSRPQRRRYLKQLAYRFVPARSLFKFFYIYLFRLGFLDGRIGFRYAVLHAFYEYEVSLKVEELKDPKSPLYHKYSHYLENDPDS